ncbi:hypothetical protein Q4508_09195 [Amphritea sp. 2_MG-2023]|jgi:hypothetical protein|uniref:hypothetical protein n=1 Tax=Amphritea TaxID=515417 RepID=UPI001C06BCA1|nr:MULTISPECIES: hypothetical protein [Amphritea]MBU2965578.1 hypothetical protein [Amphritea atlantica]MDO6418733.1 hypothetical protein [Amphritea sp. 2_MG-2023]MDX2421836.1 hypothetical protein [Amphritea sp.]
MKQSVFTGIECDDRRIASELQAMGYYDECGSETTSVIRSMFEAVSGFITWMRWKGEVGVYGCRVAADHARYMEAKVHA